MWATTKRRVGSISTSTLTPGGVSVAAVCLVVASATPTLVMISLQLGKKLIVAAAVLEVTGLVLVAWPELWPKLREAGARIQRLWSSLRLMLGRVKEAARTWSDMALGLVYRWILRRRRRKDVIVKVKATATMPVEALGPTISQDPPAGATVDQLMQFLLNERTLLLADLLKLQKDLAKHESELPRRIRKAVVESESWLLAERRWGVVLLGAGIVMATVGNVLQ